MEDEEMTNLNWLHESKNLLKSFGESVLRSVSPVQDLDDDTPPSPAHSDMPYDARQNPNCKPPDSFSCLIFMAIEDSLTKRLPVKDISTSSTWLGQLGFTIQSSMWQYLVYQRRDL